MDVDELLSAAGELLAVRSTADRPDELRRALDFVLERVGPGFTVEHFDSGNRTSALVYAAAIRPVSFRVILNAHLDVVPGAAEQFVPRRSGDRLYARGAQDMKVSALVLAAVFQETAAELPYPIALQLVTDEETGGRRGTRHQLREGVRGEFVLIGEHSGLDLVLDSKGLAEVSLVAEGRGGHGAYPWLGDNALLTLMRSIEGLLERYPMPTREVWRTTVNVADVRTDNTAVNQIPAQASARLDIRFTADDAGMTGGGTESVASYLGSFCEPGVTVTVHRIDPPHQAARDRPEIDALRRAARGEGYPAGFLRKHGAADSRFYSQLGIDAVIFGVGGDGQHGPEEYVDLTTIAPYYRALRAFLTGLTDD